MPFIQVQMLEGRTAEQKRELVAALTRETVRVAKCTPESVSIVLTEVSRDNWAAAGVMVSDKK